MPPLWLWSQLSCSLCLMLMRMWLMPSVAFWSPCSFCFQSSDWQASLRNIFSLYFGFLTAYLATVQTYSNISFCIAFLSVLDYPSKECFLWIGITVIILSFFKKITLFNTLSWMSCRHMAKEHFFVLRKYFKMLGLVRLSSGICLIKVTKSLFELQYLSVDTRNH